MASPEPSTARPIDPTALAHVRQRLLRTGTVPWLHAEVARRMAQRLEVIRLQPRCVLDWGAAAGASATLLRQAYPGARLCAVEADPAGRAVALAQAAPPRPWWRGGSRDGAVEVLDADALPAGQGQLVWANMGLQGVADPQAEMRRWLNALAVDGFLMFSTLGPGSLPELREIYRAQGWGPPCAPFVDMHDLGDMLIEAGFSDPVMDQEPLTLTWPSGQALLAELRGLGGNVDPRRGAGLRTPRWRQRLAGLLEQHALGDQASARVGLGFEIVYGHAFRPPPRPRLASQTSVPLEDLRTMARRPRRSGP
jgi:malonyl-CoA O-methyltransferase